MSTNIKRKKGFTLVELVIVIAVIAVLAAVLIPTFAGVINNSKKSAALQEATTAVTVMLIGTDATPIVGSYISVTNKKDIYWFKVDTGNKLTAVDDKQFTSITMAAGTCYKVTTAELADLSDKVTVYSVVAPVGSTITAKSLAVDTKGAATLA